MASGELLYIGETCNLSQQFNNSHYGSYGFITPAACYVGGQSTNCKINHLVMKQFEAGEPIQLYFMACVDHKQVEQELLEHFKPPYNG